MEALIILAILFAIGYLLISKGLAHKKKSPAKDPLAVKITVSTELGPASDREVPDCGAIQEGADGGWILNPKSPFPLTILDVDKQTATGIKELLDSLWRTYDRKVSQQLVEMVARTNLRCKEIEDYCSKYKPRFQKAIESLQKAHPEWANASELDRKDLLTEFREQAIMSLDMLPCNRIDSYPVLPVFLDEPEDVSIDDALIDKYSFELINFYFRYFENVGKVYRVPADRWDRKNFESLVEVNLARRGSEIPVEKLLSLLKLKEMNEMITDPEVKKFSKKADAIKYLTKDQGIKERLSKQMTYRELFQIMPLPEEFSNIDLEVVAKSWRYAEAVASIIANTYESCLASLEQKESLRGITSDIKGWEIHLYDEAPPYCKKVAERAFSSRQMPKLPAHIGCTCRAYPKFQ